MAPPALVVFQGGFLVPQKVRWKSVGGPTRRFCLQESARDSISLGLWWFMAAGTHVQLTKQRQRTRTRAVARPGQPQAEGSRVRRGRGGRGMAWDLQACPAVVASARGS